MFQDVNAKSSDKSGSRLKIIIVGAGLSGLSAAIQSALGGHSVLVLESVKGLGEGSWKVSIFALSC